MVAVEKETIYSPHSISELAMHQLAYPNVLHTPYVESVGSVNFKSELSRYQIENKLCINKIQSLHLQISSGACRGIDTSKEINELAALSGAEESRQWNITISILNFDTLKGLL